MASATAQQQFDKKIHTGPQTLAGIARGLELLARLHRVTYGPGCAHIVMERKMDSPIALSDSARACRDFDVEDPLANLGLRLLQQAQEKMRSTFGSGEATAAIFLDEMLREALRLIASGVDVVGIRRGILRQVAHTCDALEAQAMEVEPEHAVRSVIGASTYDDLNELVVRAMTVAGVDGIIRTMQSQRLDSRLQVHEGVFIEHGLASATLATDFQLGSSRLEAPRIFVTRRELTTAADVIELLDRMRASGESLLIVAPSIRDEALSTLITNHVRQTVRVAAVVAPDYGEHRDASLMELAALTGAMLDEGGVSTSFALEHLGRAAEVIVERNRTIIREPAANESLVQSFIAQVETQMAEPARTEHDRDLLRARLGRLRQRFITLDIGGVNDPVSGERLERADAMLLSARAALAGRLIPGAGSALVRAATEPADLNDAEGVREGARLVRAALLAPAWQVLRNAGIHDAAAESVIERYRRGSDEVFDVLAGCWVSRQVGPVDSLERSMGALRVAASTLAVIFDVGAAITVN